MSTETSTDLGTRHQEMLARLSLLADNPDLDQDQRDLARSWRSRLEDAARHATAPVSVAFFAQVGRGKSSLISAVTGLRLPASGSPKTWAVLPVGAGRTTLGETRIEFEAREDLALTVEPISASELRIELRLFAEDLWRRNRGRTGSGGGDGSAGEELYRLLRAWLVPGGDRDALDALARDATDAQALEQELLARIDLERRSQRLEQSFSPGDGLRTLKRTLRDLMRGELADAPAPRQVRLKIPRGTMPAAIGSIVDTQGVDTIAPEIAIRSRPDLHELLSDPNTLPIICSDFASAPDPVAVALLRSLTAPSESLGPSQAGRMHRPWRLVIVDNRERDDGDPSESERHDQERRDRVEDCLDRLRREGFQVQRDEVVAIDARCEAQELLDTLALLVDSHQKQRARLWEETWKLANEAIESIDDVEAAAGKRLAVLRMWWVWDAVLAGQDAQPVEGLTILSNMLAEEGHILHWSHLYATSRRRGRYHKLSLDLLGAYSSITVLLKAHKETFERLLELEAAEVVGSTRDNANELTADFFGASSTFIHELIMKRRASFAAYFESPEADDLWSWCTARWGQGPGYVQDVADRFRQQAQRTPLILPAPPIEAFEEHLPRRPDLYTLRAVEIRNFHGISHRSIPITESMTVLVGDNGAGKTGWLEAIAAGVSVLLPGVGAGQAATLSPGDVREVIRPLGPTLDRQPQLPLTIRLEATIQGRALEWGLRKDAPDDDATVVDDDGLQVIAKQMGEEIRAHSERQLPVLAYYGTQRLWQSIRPSEERGKVATRLDGYRDCLEAASSHELMQTRMRHYTLVQLQRGTPIPLLRAVEQAVMSCVEEASAFHYDLELEDFVLTLHDGSIQPFRTLSDGYRNIVAMVADIAWRASALNPQLGERAPLLAEGVVLIDEIDLHLHPRWQRRVLGDLHRAFPRLQFITTTHSPFIIQSLEPGQLVNLDPDIDIDIEYANASPEDIAEHVMGVDVPQRSERRRREYEVAKRYYDLLDRVPEADEQELLRLKTELDEILAPYADNQALVAFLERKRLLAEARRS